jgi:cbb3-type cytochrome oxidase maturation protein
MSALFVLVLVSVAVAIFFLVIFIKAVKSGQYEDDYSPAVRILFENTSASHSSDETNKQTDKQ